jgi:DNA-binding winged helix-turn-helix (wHTH) protein
MAVCPRCHQPIRHERFGVYLPVLKARIVDAIAAAGDAGINTDALIRAVWRGERATRNCVKSHVQQINDALVRTSVCIRCERRGGKPGLYKIVRQGGRAAA